MTGEETSGMGVNTPPTTRPHPLWQTNPGDGFISFTFDSLSDPVMLLHFMKSSAPSVKSSFLAKCVVTLNNNGRLCLCLTLPIFWGDGQFIIRCVLRWHLIWKLRSGESHRHHHTTSCLCVMCGELRFAIKMKRRDLCAWRHWIICRTGHVFYLNRPQVEEVLFKSLGDSLAQWQTPKIYKISCFLYDTFFLTTPKCIVVGIIEYNFTLLLLIIIPSEDGSAVWKDLLHDLT